MSSRFKNVLKKYKDAVVALSFIGVTAVVALVVYISATLRQEPPLGPISNEELGIVEWTFSEKEAITKLHISTDYSTVHIMTTEEVDEITVFGQQASQQDTITAVVEDGVLTVTETESGNGKKDNSYLRIQLPAGVSLTEIVVESDGGLVSYAADISLEQFTCKLVSGEFAAEEIRSKQCNITTEDAGIAIYKSCGEIMILQCNTGNVTLKDATITKSMQMSCKSGKVQLELTGDSKDYGFSMKNTSGIVKIGKETMKEGCTTYNDYETAEVKIDMECGDGRINILFAKE